MNLNLWHQVACLALLLPVLAASGCTGTDVLTPTAGNVRIEIDVVNIPDGYRFEISRFRIDQIRIRPLDEGANDALGDNPLGLLQNQVTINFDLAAPKETLLTLHTGTYRLEEITVSNFNFRDTDPTPDPLPPTCEDYISRYRSGDGGAGIREFSEDILVTILGSEENVVRIEFDWTVFVEAMQAAWPCEWCAEDWDECGDDDFGFLFNETTFNNYVPDFLSVN